MKAQLFSPVYTVIFAGVIISVLVIFNTVVKEWEVQSLLMNEAISFEALLNLLSLFDDCQIVYNTGLVFNLSISESITLANGVYSVSFGNDYMLPFTEVSCKNSLIVERANGEWVIHD